MTLASCQDMEHVVHVAGFWHKASALRIKLSACWYQKRGIAGGYLQAEFRGPPCGPRNETTSWARRFWHALCVAQALVPHCGLLFGPIMRVAVSAREAARCYLSGELRRQGMFHD